MKQTMHWLLAITALLLTTNTLKAQLPPLQTLEAPMESQRAAVIQRVGMTDIRIDYHRPAVKGRKIWGTVVPFDGKPYPWRAGANENTTIELTHDVMIQGKVVPAGKYGLHMIPSEKEWTVIFSRNNTSWGSFFYKPAEDVVRVTAYTDTADMHEYLQYQFDEVTDSSAVVALLWERKKIFYKVDVDVKKIMLENMRNAARTPLAFSWQGMNSLADYCLRQNYNLDEALKWIDASIRADENLINTRTKGNILRAMGKVEEGDKAMDKAISNASAVELSRSGNFLVIQKNWQDAKKVLDVAYAKFPKTFSVTYNLGLVARNNADKESAKKYFTEAQSLATDERTKQLVKTQLESL